MKKALKWIGIVLGVLIVIAVAAVLILSEPLPEGEQGEAADALARRVEAAINKEAWDSTRYVQWTFVGIHHYIWDKENHIVDVRWGDNRVLLNPNEISGKVWEDGQEVTGDAASKKVQQAWSFFANDSFWLNAPAKVFDPGTERRLVKIEDGSEALLISYTSGGVTPGDSYLWLLDENDLPKAWKMWVKVVPIKGLENSWEGWTTLSTGAKIATAHSVVPVTITNLEAGQSLGELGLEEDMFE
ncbi:MAG: hypothetical protein AAGI23_21110 [Bacteroidota bacterium]